MKTCKIIDYWYHVYEIDENILWIDESDHVSFYIFKDEKDCVLTNFMTPKFF